MAVAAGLLRQGYPEWIASFPQADAEIRSRSSFALKLPESSWLTKSRCHDRCATLAAPVYQKHMVSVWKNWLKNWLITASFAVAGGMVFGMAAFIGFRLNVGQKAP